MSKILLIGGSGYIGSRLQESLDVDVIDTNWFNDSEACIDYRELTREDHSKYDTIILLAGHSSVKMSEGNLNSCFNNNVRNFIDLIEKLDKQKLIYASSSSVYGSVGGRTVNEKYHG